MFKKFSSILVPLTLMAAPQAPSNLKLIPHTKSVDISWDDNSQNESGFKIFRDDKLIAIVASDMTRYTDYGLELHTKYRYTIKSTDDEILPLNTTKITYQPNETVSINVNTPLSGDRDWVGIYKVGDNNTLENILAWNWVGQGTTLLNKDKKPMPAGEYEARLFFHNSLNLEASYAFKVGVVDDYETAGPFEVEQYPKDGLSDEKYIVYYPKNAISKDMPVVLFLEGGGKGTKITDYKGIMKYLASRGYFVIGGETGAGYDIKNYVHIFENAINTAKDAHGLSMKRLAVMGHSQGGGDSFYIMKYFQDKGYGSDASLVLSIDGWFAFDMNQDDLRNLRGDVRFLQMNGLVGTGTDPRIKLSIWNLSSQTDRKFLTLPEKNHGYVKGDFADILGKKDLIHIVGALCDDTFDHVSFGYDSIDESRKATFGEIERELDDKANYYGDCVGIHYNAREGQLKDYDIDYCAYELYR